VLAPGDFDTLPMYPAADGMTGRLPDDIITYRAPVQRPAPNTPVSAMGTVYPADTVAAVHSATDFPEDEPIAHMVVQAGGLAADTPINPPLEEPDPEAAVPDCCVPGRPLVIIKTNLLYDVALTPHLGVEVPIGERFSVSAEFMRGWWLKRDNSFCWQLEAAALEGRYWFSPLMERHRHGGWFAGIAVQAGFYDFQLHHTRGAQGEVWMAGVTGGYLCPLSSYWSLEFTLGIGCLRTNYRRYNLMPTHNGYELVASAPSTRLTGVLYPLKAGISIQWAIRSKK
jgi:hypothetical protein